MRSTNAVRESISELRRLHTGFDDAGLKELLAKMTERMGNATLRREFVAEGGEELVDISLETLNLASISDVQVSILDWMEKLVLEEKYRDLIVENHRDKFVEIIYNMVHFLHYKKIENNLFTIIGHMAAKTSFVDALTSYDNGNIAHYWLHEIEHLDTGETQNDILFSTDRMLENADFAGRLIKEENYKLVKILSDKMQICDNTHIYTVISRFVRHSNIFREKFALENPASNINFLCKRLVNNHERSQGRLSDVMDQGRLSGLIGRMLEYQASKISSDIHMGRVYFHLLKQVQHLGDVRGLNYDLREDIVFAIEQFCKWSLKFKAEFIAEIKNDHFDFLHKLTSSTSLAFNNWQYKFFDVMPYLIEDSEISNDLLEQKELLQRVFKLVMSDNDMIHLSSVLTFIDKMCFRKVEFQNALLESANIDEIVNRLLHLTKHDYDRIRQSAYNIISALSNNTKFRYSLINNHNIVEELHEKLKHIQRDGSNSQIVSVIASLSLADNNFQQKFLEYGESSKEDIAKILCDFIDSSQDEELIYQSNKAILAFVSDAGFFQIMQSKYNIGQRFFNMLQTDEEWFRELVIERFTIFLSTEEDSNQYLADLNVHDNDQIYILNNLLVDANKAKMENKILNLIQLLSRNKSVQEYILSNEVVFTQIFNFLDNKKIIAKDKNGALDCLTKILNADNYSRSVFEQQITENSKINPGQILYQLSQEVEGSNDHQVTMAKTAIASIIAIMSLNPIFKKQIDSASESDKTLPEIAQPKPLRSREGAQKLTTPTPLPTLPNKPIAVRASASTISQHKTSDLQTYINNAGLHARRPYNAEHGVESLNMGERSVEGDLPGHNNNYITGGVVLAATAVGICCQTWVNKVTAKESDKAHKVIAKESYKSHIA